MAQTGYTPIQLYHSTSAGTSPSGANLASGEVALNVTDGKLYYKDGGGTVQLLASKDASSGTFSNVTITSNLTLSGGTANGVLYLNGSKVATSGSALVFDGTNLGVGTSSPATKLHVSGQSRVADSSNAANYMTFGVGANAPYGNASISTTTAGLAIVAEGAGNMTFLNNGSERMRIDSSGNLSVTGTLNSTGSLTVQTGGIIMRNATGNGLLQDSAGSAASPTYSFYNNADLGMYRSVADTLAWATGGTQRMTLDSSGNLGIGTSSPGNKLTVASTANDAGKFTSTATTTALVLDNTHANGWGSNLAIQTGGTAAGFFGTIGSLLGNTTQDLAVYANTGNGFRVYTNGNNLRATFDTSGNLGIGTSSPGSKVTISDPGTGLGFTNAASGNFNIGLLAGTGSAVAYVFQRANADLIFGTNNTERARITSGGYSKFSNTGTYYGSTSSYHEFRNDADNAVLIVSSSSTGSNVANVYSELSSGANAGAYHFGGVVTGSGYQFTVDKDGDVKNTNNSYGSISDVKVKQDIADASSQWDDIKGLRVRKYRFKNKPDEALQIGVIAQEIEQVSPGLVDETPDFEEVEVTDEEGNVKTERQPTGTVTKSVKYSVLYMKAVKALQEAMARIEKLEAEVAAMKGA